MSKLTNLKSSRRKDWQAAWRKSSNDLAEEYNNSKGEWVMKKQTGFFILILLLAVLVPVQAAEPTKSPPLEWQISVLPKPTQEEIEKQRWSYVFSNDIGKYAFDKQSLCIDEMDKNAVHVLTKTIFTDQKVISSLNKKYMDKLAANDKVLASEIEMVFQIRQKTYAIVAMKVWSEQGVSLEDTKQAGRFAPVTPQTFADTMYDIARSFVRNG